MQAIPESMQKSRGLQLVISQGWNWRESTGEQIQVENCPFCGKGDFKFYMACCDPKESSRDSLYFCHHGSCSKTGNYRTLSEHLGIRIAGVESRSEWAGKGDSKPDSLPDVEACHRALLGDAEALDYLLNVRKFTKEIIDRQKLGLKEKVWFRKSGETKALVIPYLSTEGNVTYAKYRTLPPAEKDFITPSGWDAQLFNGQVLQEGCKEVIFLEGECDVLSCMSNGIEYAVGVPGANVKKAEWIAVLDKVAPEKIYLLYDNDSVGQRAAQEMASRIGIDKCLKITLPKDVKDINEFFAKGGTLEAFEKFKAAAQLYDITGVTSSVDALQQLEDELNGKVDLAPKYVFQWPELNRLIGMEDGDVLDIVAPEKVGKTTFGLNILDHMVAKYGENGLLVCLEMTQARLARKWVALVTGFEDTITEPGTPEAKAKLEELKASCVTARSIQQSRGADLYFAYPLLIKESEDALKLIRDCIRRYGIEWIMLDNIQRLCDDTLKNQGHRTVHLSQISKGLAKLAKDYRIKLIRILQPKRIEKGQTISTNDVDGSSQIAKDCDGMITLWRAVVGEQKKSEWETQQQGFVESCMSFEPIMKVSVGLSRYSAGGTTKLYYDGARSQVRSIEESQKKAMTPEQLPQGSIPMEGGGYQAVAMEEPQTVSIPTEGEITI
jgi:replicative DNA helicase/5S rRNA maturation endonuclease (ribonuclease M5)